MECIREAAFVVGRRSEAFCLLLLTLVNEIGSLVDAKVVQVQQRANEHGWSQEAQCYTRALSSSRQSQITNIRKIYTKSPAFLLSWSALSRHKWLGFMLARYGRPSRSRGISSRTINRMRYARAAGFDDSIAWTSVAA